MWTEPGSRRFIVFAFFAFAVFRIKYYARVAIWVSEVFIFLCGYIQFIRRKIISKHIATIISKPQIIRLRGPGKSNSISYALGEYFEAAAISVHSHDRCITFIFFVVVTNVARCANRYI